MEAVGLLELALKLNFVILPVVLPAIVLPLTVWLSWVVVCASADIAPKFIDATTPTTNIPTVIVVTPNSKLFCMWRYTTKFLFNFTIALISGQR